MTEKRFNVFDVDGIVFLEDHIEGSYHIGEKENVDIHCLNDIADRLNTYADENEQLKQTNQRLNDELQDCMGKLALKRWCGMTETVQFLIGFVIGFVVVFGVMTYWFTRWCGMTEKRFMVDDAGTLIDMETRNMYELAYEVVDLLNELNNENTLIKTTIKEAYQTERTQIGQNVLKQLLEQLEWNNNEW